MTRRDKLVSPGSPSLLPSSVGRSSRRLLAAGLHVRRRSGASSRSATTQSSGFCRPHGLTQEEAASDAGGAPSRAAAVGTVNWGTATLVGVFTGLLYGGSKEANANVSKDAEVMLKMGSTTDKREQYRLMRDAMEKRFIRVAKGSLVGGARLGMFTATFFGLQNLLIENRGVHDVFNIAGAGSATAAVFGLILPGSPMWRARNVLVGSALGAGICFPLGWVQLKLAEKANLEIENSKSPSDLEQGNQSRVGAAIDRLGSSLRK